MIDPPELVRRLQSEEFRCRTGILLVPQTHIGREAEIAVRLNVQYEDLTNRLLQTVPPGSGYLNLTLESLFDQLDDIANSSAGMGCVLVAQIDVAVMKLNSHERARLWRDLLTNFPHRRKAMVIGIPGCMDGIRVLQEQSIMEEWVHAERMAIWS